MNSKNKTISDIGEFGVIDRIKKYQPNIKNSNIDIGIGDDTAVLNINNNKKLLVTCDIQIEGQHFNREYITPYQLGRRAIAINLSDIAAMGGKPTFALISLGLQDSFKTDDLELLYQGFNDQLTEFSASIIGGNLSKSHDKLIIDITMMGEAEPGKVIARNGAKVGDRIFITNYVGLSVAGFYVLNQFGNNYPAHFKKYVSAHLCPIPRVEIGQKIADSGFATAMIDVSDGVVSDLFHICEMSRVGAEIFEKNIHRPENYTQVETITNKSFIELALHGGEDYELLFTITPDAEISDLIEKFDLEIFEIGRIVDQERGFNLIDNNNKSIAINPRGWDHFKK